MTFSDCFSKKRKVGNGFAKEISGEIIKKEKVVRIKLLKGKNLMIYKVLIKFNFSSIECFTSGLNFLKLGDFVKGANEKFLYYRGARFILVKIFEKKRKSKETEDSLQLGEKYHGKPHTDPKK